MNDITPFLEFLNQFVDVSREEFETLIAPYITIRRFDEKELVTRIGTVEDYFNFLLTGLARAYYLKNGQQVTTQIATSGHIIHAQESFYSRQPSTSAVETIEASRFVSITYDDLEKIYTLDHKMQQLGRRMITYTMLQIEKLQLQTLTLTPRERFLQFMEQNPGLLHRLPQKYLASYLNIQPETFSRFKHLLRKPKSAA